MCLFGLNLPGKSQTVPAPVIATDAIQLMDPAFVLNSHDVLLHSFLS